MAAQASAGPLESVLDGDSFIILTSSPDMDYSYSSPQTLDSMHDRSCQLEPASHVPLAALSLNMADEIMEQSNSSNQIKNKISELLEENMTLRETLKENNTSIKELFENVTKWQDDMMNTHVLHKNKFSETKEYVERLKAENLHLKTENEKLKNEIANQITPIKEQPFEMIDSDSIVEKLTAQLSLVEKQRRQVIVENEKLTIQLESLEKVLKTMTNENENFQSTILELNKQIDENSKFNGTLMCKDKKISSLQNEIKELHTKLLETENMKIEYLKQKQETQEYIKQLNSSILELKSKFREIQSIAFHPTRISLCNESSDGKNLSEFYTKIKQFDKTSLELASLLNNQTGELSTIFEIVIDQLNASCDPNCNISELKENLSSAKRILIDHQKVIAGENVQIKSLLASYEEMLRDHKVCLNILDDMNSNQSKENDKIIAESIAQREKIEFYEKELTSLKATLNTLQKNSEENEVLKVQLDIYKSDFEIERDARASIASEKEDILSNLRILQNENQRLREEMEKVNKNDQSKTGIFGYLMGPSSSTSEVPRDQNSPNYPCMICNKSFKTAILLEDHIHLCISNTD